jgi:flagellar protein FliO/FliZ
MLFSLITVLAIIMLLAWLLRRFNLGVQGNSGAIKVLTTLTLGKSERLVLVEVGEQQLLLGVTAQNITLLQTLEQPLELSSQPLQATPRLFQEKLKGFLNKTEKS